MPERIDPDSWPRREPFAFFSTLSNPFYAVTFRQDVTRLRAYTKAAGLPFYYALIWLCTEAVNRTEAFRYVIRQGEVFRIDGRMPSFTDLKAGSENFHIVTMPHISPLPDFCREARRRSEAQTSFLDAQSETDALIYYSCLPWIDLTAVSHERDFSGTDARDDAVPRITWGKYVPRASGRLELGLSVEVNHRLIDGLHIGQFAAQLDALIAALPED